jgi:hypothetical protein
MENPSKTGDFFLLSVQLRSLWDNSKPRRFDQRQGPKRDSARGGDLSNDLPNATMRTRSSDVKPILGSNPITGFRSRRPAPSPAEYLSRTAPRPLNM